MLVTQELINSLRILASSSDPDCCSFPKGCRFESVRLCRDTDGDYFLHGIGFLGCHTLIDLSPVQLLDWSRLFKAALLFDQEANTLHVAS